MKPYSLDLRKKIVEVYATEQISQRKLAERFHVALSFIEKVLTLGSLILKRVFEIATAECGV
mgnify:CR=1